MSLVFNIDKQFTSHFRLDSKSLIQRYNANQDPKGQLYHRSANLFSSYEAERNRSEYVSVAVRFVKYEKGDNTVQVIRKAGTSSNSGVGSAAGATGAQQQQEQDP